MVNSFSIFLVFLGSVVGSAGTLLVKKGTLKHSFFHLFLSGHLWVGLILYALSVILYVIALQREELSVIYPFVSLSYIWITLFSVKFLGEKMNKWKWISLLGVVIGIVLIGLGS